MKKQSKRRSALLMSFSSLLLCFAMLVSTTFAWFTDSVTSGVNKIVAGNLDVELYHAKGTVTAGSEKVDTTTELFKVDKWEPGVVAYENFLVKNVGNLALKYQLAMTVGDFNKTVDGNHTLKEVLKVAVVPGGFTGTTRADAQALTGYTSLDEFSVSSEKSLLPDSTGDTFGVVIYWEPNVQDDNLYNLNNGKKAVPSNKFGDTELGIELGIQLIASQLEHEYDSFGNDYDGDSSYSETVAATIETNKDTVFYSAVTPSNEDGNTTKVTVPSTVASFTAGSTTTMTVEATPAVAANNTFTISSNGAVGAIDLTVKVGDVVVEQFKNGSGEAIPVTVETYVAKNLTNVSLQYNGGEGEQPTNVTYDATTGKLIFQTTHFSTFVLGADEVAYVERTNMAYLTVSAAIDAAQDGDVIVLLANIVLGSSEKVTVNKTITLNMNKKTITGSAQNLVQVGSETTIGHLTIRGNGSIFSSDENMLTVNPNSTLDIYDGNYEGLTRTFNVLGGKVTTYGGSFSTTDTRALYLANLENACYCNFLGGTFTTPTNGNYGIFIRDASVVNLGAEGEAGPSFSTWRPCIATNGMYSHEATINIYSGTYKSNRTNSTPDDQSVIQLANDSSQTQTLNVYGGYFEQTAAPNGSVFHVRYHGTININISGGSFKHLGSSLFTGFGRDGGSGWPTQANIGVNVTNNAIAGTQTVLMYGSGGARLTERDFVVSP